MTLWQRIKARFAQPDPYDALPTTNFPDSNPPPPSSMFVPGEAEWLLAQENGPTDLDDKR